MLRLLAILLLTLCGTSAACFAEGTLWNELTPQQQDQLRAGNAVEIEENIPESAWPRFTIYYLVQGSPAAVAAVFWNCELAPTYVPNCSSVRILSHPSESINEAEYTLKMPFFLPDEVYISRNELSRHSPSSYEISWKTLKSRYTKACFGNLRIEEYGDKALLRYSNLVIPGSKFARLLRGSAGNQVSASMHAIVGQVALEFAKDPKLLEQQLQELEHSQGHSPLKE